ncbi:hypothetical protein ACWDR3_29900 [Streptomyces sp. NPDC001002]
MMGHLAAQTVERVSRDWPTAPKRTYELYVVEPWMLAATAGTVLSIRESGDGGARAAQFSPGTRALVEGPYGTMTSRERRWPKMLLIAAGVGVTPLGALLEDTAYGPGEATLIYRYSSAADQLFKEELHELATRHRSLRLVADPTVRKRHPGSEKK